MTVAACPGCALHDGGAVARSEPAAADTRTIRLHIPGLHCAGCIADVERTVSAVPGVAKARVNLGQKRLTVELDARLSEEPVMNALSASGREAQLLNDDLLAGEDDPVGRRLLASLAVSGFTMMNVMLLSVSVWSGAEDTMREFLHWVSVAIALPAVAFAARPFFEAALRALTARRLNMDVPIAVAIALAAAMSLYETVHGGRHAYFDAALSLTFFLLLGRYLDHRARTAARSAARELSALESARAVLLRPDGEDVVDVAELRVGDMVRVAPGMRAPVDGVVVDGTADLDRSHLTGETTPEIATPGAVVESGAMVLTAPLTLRATATGDETSLRQMAEMIEAAEAGRARYASLADRAAKIYAPAVHLLALFAFIGWVWADGDIRFALNVAVAVLIITCPCALGLAAPAVATAAAGRLFRAGVLLKRADALERLAEIDTAVFDKTGALTTGTPRLISDHDDRTLSRALALAGGSAHPFAKAVAEAARSRGFQPVEMDAPTEHPGAGVEAQYNGAPARFGSAAWVGAADDAGASVWLKIDGEAAIRFDFAEALRPGAEELIRSLKDEGVDIVILSGDGHAAVDAIADRPGVPYEARLTPADKLSRIEAMTRSGRKPLMFGDGLNDAAALAGAHVSIAPASALDCARVASDIVLLNGDLRGVAAARRIAISSRARILENFAAAGAYNLIAVPIALAGFATPFIAALAMSASSITVSLNALRLPR